MIKENIDTKYKKNGLVNNAIVILKKISKYEIVVHVLQTNKVCYLRPLQVQLKIQKNGRTFQWYRHQYPMDYFWTSTIHRFQGKNITEPTKSLIIDLFETQMLYTLLGRYSKMKYMHFPIIDEEILKNYQGVNVMFKQYLKFHLSKHFENMDKYIDFYYNDNTVKDHNECFLNRVKKVCVDAMSISSRKQSNRIKKSTRKCLVEQLNNIQINSAQNNIFYQIYPNFNEIEKMILFIKPKINNKIHFSNLKEYNITKNTQMEIIPFAKLLSIQKYKLCEIMLIDELVDIYYPNAIEIFLKNNPNQQIKDRFNNTVWLEAKLLLQNMGFSINDVKSHFIHLITLLKKECNNRQIFNFKNSSDRRMIKKLMIMYSKSYSKEKIKKLLTKWKKNITTLSITSLSWWIIVREIKNKNKILNKINVHTVPNILNIFPIENIDSNYLYKTLSKKYLYVVYIYNDFKKHRLMINFGNKRQYKYIRINSNINYNKYKNNKNVSKQSKRINKNNSNL